MNILNYERILLFYHDPYAKSWLIFISIFFFRLAIPFPTPQSHSISQISQPEPSQSFVVGNNVVLFLASANIIFFMIVSGIQKLSVKRKDGDKDCCTFVHT